CGFTSRLRARNERLWEALWFFDGQRRVRSFFRNGCARFAAASGSTVLFVAAWRRGVPDQICAEPDGGYAHGRWQICCELAGNSRPIAGGGPGEQVSAGERTNGGANNPALRISRGLERGEQSGAGILADNFPEPANFENR